MNKNAQIYYKNAQELGLPIVHHQEIGVLKIKLGNKNHFIWASTNPLNIGVSSLIARNKYFSNKLLEASGFPVPEAIYINSADFDFTLASLSRYVEKLNFPLVAKPMSGTGRGRNILCNIKNIETLFNYLKKHFKRYTHIHIEEFHKGLKEYRVLVLKKRVIAVVERFAAQVTGDGIHTVEQLIAIKNRERDKLSSFLTISPLVVDEEYLECLAEQEISLDNILENGKQIRLCYTANTGRGGEIYSRGKQIHPQNAKLLVKAAKAMGLDFVGLDVLCEDIDSPFAKTKWLILEANHNPDLTIHESPDKGTPVRVARAILKQLIWRHPFSYLKNYLKNTFYLRVGLIIGGLALAFFLFEWVNGLLT